MISQSLMRLVRNILWLCVAVAMIAAGSFSHARFAGSAKKVVLLDCHFNNEWKKNSTGELVRYHYVWDDTTNSGYSQLARIIEHGGAIVDTLCVAPTLEKLQPAGVYIIVDPDTPEETTDPHYIDEQTIEVLTKRTGSWQICDLSIL